MKGRPGPRSTYWTSAGGTYSWVVNSLNNPGGMIVPILKGKKTEPRLREVIRSFPKDTSVIT